MELDYVEAYKTVAQFIMVVMWASGYFFFKHQHSLFAKYTWRLSAVVMAIIIVIDFIFGITENNR